MKNVFFTYFMQKSTGVMIFLCVKYLCEQRGQLVSRAYLLRKEIDGAI